MRSWLRRRAAARKPEAGADWYDDHYRRVDEYAADPRDTRYFPVWAELVERAKPAELILEVGCGSGQLAQMLAEHHADGYVGFDFSPGGIEMARKLAPQLEFHVADARTTPLLDEVPYDTVVCTEVLEHIADDLGVVARIRPGTRVLATVPSFDAETHLRFFSSETEVEKRYRPLIEPIAVSAHRVNPRATLYLIDGRRREDRPPG